LTAASKSYAAPVLNDDFRFHLSLRAGQSRIFTGFPFFQNRRGMDPGGFNRQRQTP
jgi:hypothetical protein